MIPRRSVTGFPRLLREIAAARDVEGARARLEEEFYRRFGCAAAVATPSGRFALELLVRAAEPAARRAYVPAYTIAAVPQIFRDAGYEVVFIDVDPQTTSLTPEILRRAHRGPGLLLVTHYFGLPADMGPITAIARELGLTIIEDIAHAPGVAYGGKALGTFGAGGFYSFETRKPLNGLGGGMAVTSDPAVARALRAYAAGARQGAIRTARKVAMATAEWLSLTAPVFSAIAPLLHRGGGEAGPLVKIYRRWHAQGRTAAYAFSDLQAWLVLRQLDGLPASIDARRRIAATYDRGLPAGVVRPFDSATRRHSYYCYVATHPRAADLGRHLRSRGVDCGIGPEVLPDCAPDLDLPGTKAAAAGALELPISDRLSDRDAARVCAAAAGWTA